VRIPGEAVVNLVEAGEEVSDSVKLGSGEFSIVRLVQGNTGIALFVKVGKDVRWPLTKDEPTLKLDSRHYLFSIRPPPDEEATDKDETDKDEDKERENDKDSSEILNYGVTFADEEDLDSLDSFLEQHACLSLPTESISTTDASRCSCIPEWKRLNPRFGKSETAYWTELAPRVEDYNSVVGKAIAAGSGQIIKGLFICSNAYTAQVKKGGEFVQSRVRKTTVAADHEKKKSNHTKISPGTKRNIRRVKKLSRMTENLTENVLAELITITGAVTAPMLESEAGQKFFSMLPGDVLLASLDAFSMAISVPLPWNILNKCCKWLV
jgi:spartin